MSNYQLHLPDLTENNNDFGDGEAQQLSAYAPIDTEVRVYKPTHIESIMRSIIGPSFDKMIAKQEVINE